MKDDVTIGIDLGTSNSCVALYTEKPEIVLNRQGGRTTPSVLAFAQDGRVLVGLPAWRQAIMNPARTITAVKRLVGRPFTSEVVETLRPILPYELSKATNGDTWIRVGEEEISPQEVQAYILEELRDGATRFVGAQVRRAVITVPAFFDEVQRQAVRDAAEIAGFESARIVSEPTAAALAYGYGQHDGKRIVIVDFGGGTLDVTVMKVDRGRFEVLATDGDLLLGGHDFDRAIATALAREIEEAHDVDVLGDPVALQRLMAEAEEAKRKLSEQTRVEIQLRYLIQAEDGPVDYERVLTRQQLEDLTRGEVERLLRPCRAALEEAGLRPSECDDVILVGGMTRAPVIQSQIAALFERRPSLRINPDEAVAIGAALLAGGPRADVTFVDVAPRTIGLRAAGDRLAPLIAKSTPLPATVTKGFATTMDGQKMFELKVYQGEDPVASRNRQLANVLIEDIPPRPAGEVKLKVTFVADDKGALQFGATELSTGREIQVDVQPLSGLGRPLVKRLAAEHRARRGEEEEAKSTGATDAAGGAESAVQAGFAIEFGSPDPAPAPPPEAKEPDAEIAAEAGAPPTTPAASEAGAAGGTSARAGAPPWRRPAVIAAVLGVAAAAALWGLLA